MFTDFKNTKKYNHKLPKSTINQTLPKIKNKSQINQTKNKLPKVYNSPLSSSINILYKSLFPDEKNSLDNFLENFPNKFIKKPKWEFSTSKTRGDDIIRKELMKKNRTLRSYEYLRQPTKLKKIKIKKPNMVRIIEDNFCYKYRYFLNPWQEEYNLYKRNKNNNKFETRFLFNSE